MQTENRMISRPSRPAVTSNRNGRIPFIGQVPADRVSPCGPLDRILKHALRVLPDSITEQRRLFKDVELWITPAHPLYDAVQARLALIKSLEATQEEFVLRVMAWNTD
jgi:hypothetical protein